MDIRWGSIVVGLIAVLVGGCAAQVDGAGSAEAELRRGQTCGGIAGLPCPSGYECADDPRDSCDPDRGGADCGGICRRARRTRCDYSDPQRSYVSRDPEECAAIRFVCESGSAFFDTCGCGCEVTSCASIGLCVDGYVWDDATCSCQPLAGERCGDAVCGAGLVCCNASCGICTPPGYFCTQQACEPAI